MNAPVKITNSSVIISGTVEVSFSDKPSPLTAENAASTTNYALKLNHGFEMLTVLDTSVEPTAPDDQYSRLENAREGFERNTKLISERRERRFIARMPTLAVTYSVKDSKNESVPMHCLWFQVSRWLVHLQLVCPSEEYGIYKAFLEGVRALK